MACCALQTGFRPTNRWSKEVTHATNRRSRRSPPRPPVVETQKLSRLWSMLTDEQRQRAILTLSGIVLRQLGAHPEEREVRDEC
jgi:hypothetical protein